MIIKPQNQSFFTDLRRDKSLKISSFSCITIFLDIFYHNLTSNISKNDFFQFFPDLRLGKENFTSKKYWNISKFGDFVVVQGLVQSTRYLAFLPKLRIFRKFSKYFYTDHPQKSLFIAFLLTNFTKISKKVLKNFSRRLRRRKRVEISPFFHPWSVDGTPP